MNSRRLRPHGGGWTPISHGDLTPDILSRLPAKSVIRFRCVCRRWLSLTSDYMFLRLHTLRNPHPAIVGLILTPKSPKFLQFYPFPGRLSPGLPDPSLSFLADQIAGDGHSGDDFSISNICNGLVLCNAHYSTYRFPPYYVCNPTTRECCRIPTPPTRLIQAIALFFDPSSASSCCRPLLHYKVFCLGVASPFRAPLENEILIYSSLTKSWRHSGKPFALAGIDRSRYSAVSCGGAVHWAGHWKDRLVSFEVEKERIQVTPLPPQPGAGEGKMVPNRRRVVYFGESGGHLHLMEFHACDIFQLHIFELNKDYSGWRQLHCIRQIIYYSWDPVTARKVVEIPIPVCILRHHVEDVDGEEKDLLLWSLKGRITSYNLQTMAPGKEVHHLSCDFAGFKELRWLKVAPYAHTLFSP